MRRALVLATGVAACAAAPAHAGDFYVTKTGLDTNPCSAAQPCASAQGAAGKPAVVDGDVIHIAAGTYTGSAGSVATTKRLTFAGDGSLGCGNAGTTYLDAATTTVPAVTLSRGGAVSNLCARGGFGGADNVAPAAAVALTSTDPTAAYELTDVDATGGAKGTTSAEGLKLSDDATRTIALTMTRGSYRTPLGGVAVRVSGTNVALTGTLPTIIAGTKGTGLSVETGAAATLDQASILDAAGQTTGARAGGQGSELTLTRSTISARSYGVLASSSVFDPAGSATATVDTSLVLVHKTADVSGGHGVHAAASGAGRTASIAVRSSTVIADGPAAVAALSATGVSSGAATVTATGTYASASDTDGTPGDADLVADASSSGTATITATYSAFADRQELHSGTAT
ncbi:MAG: hypothetical protein QOG68_2720, partial [Solirubrobacteraceae bacterium]|nr:hypothetical protein [Solirubrobacteraceae bacterium]